MPFVFNSSLIFNAQPIKDSLILKKENVNALLSKASEKQTIIYKLKKSYLKKFKLTLLNWNYCKNLTNYNFFIFSNLLKSF